MASTMVSRPAPVWSGGPRLSLSSADCGASWALTLALWDAQLRKRMRHYTRILNLRWQGVARPRGEQAVLAAALRRKGPFAFGPSAKMEAAVMVSCRSPRPLRRRATTRSIRRLRASPPAACPAARPLPTQVWAASQLRRAARTFRGRRPGAASPRLQRGMLAAAALRCRLILQRRPRGPRLALPPRAHRSPRATLFAPGPCGVPGARRDCSRSPRPPAQPARPPQCAEEGVLAARPTSKSARWRALPPCRLRLSWMQRLVRQLQPLLMASPCRRKPAARAGCR